MELLSVSEAKHLFGLVSLSLVGMHVTVELVTFALYYFQFTMHTERALEVHTIDHLSSVPARFSSLSSIPEIVHVIQISIVSRGPKSVLYRFS